MAHISVGHDVLIYQRAANARLMMMDRSGVETSLVQQAAVYHRPSVSPDGRTIALDIEGDRDGQRDVWTLDIASGTLSRLTNVGDGHDASWTPDGRRLPFLTNERPGGDLYVVPFDRSGPPQPFPMARGFPARLLQTPGNWTPDGRAYIGRTDTPRELGDIWLLPADGSAPQPLANSEANEDAPTASPDGRWFAYASNESGRQEVYVQALRPSGARTQVSRAGGSSPVWAPGGSALYYLEPNGNNSNLVQVTLDLRAEPRIASRLQLVTDVVPGRAINHANFAVMPNGRQFVVVVPEPGQGIIEVSGWAAALGKH